MKAVIASTMQDLERRTIAAGTSGAVLMERAGIGAWHELQAFAGRLAPRHSRRLVVLAGAGNNGGDGYVVARLAAGTGWRVTIFSPVEREKLTGEARLQADHLPTTVTHTVCAGDLPFDALQPGDLVLDCLLGTGARGPVRAPINGWISAVNASGLPVVAMDLPSGLDADTGAVANVGIQADLTVTIGLPKLGLFEDQGPALSGRLRVVDIGIAATLIADAPSPLEVVTHADMRPFVGRLGHDVHKGKMGRILVVGGSGKYPGAPMLVGAAALRGGGGLVSVAYPMAIGALLGQRPNGLVLSPVPDNQFGFLNAASANELRRLVEGQDAVVVGPGLGLADDTMNVARQLQGIAASMVLDADGLQILVSGSYNRPRHAATVLTPHPGEMERLLKGAGRHELIHASRREQVVGLATHRRAYVVLKGPGTLIATPDGTWVRNTTGSPALATGGTGDVLAGLVAAFLCQVADPFSAVKLAVFVHGLAAELSPRGQRGMIADDLPELFGAALRDLSPFA